MGAFTLRRVDCRNEDQESLMNSGIEWHRHRLLHEFVYRRFQFSSQRDGRPRWGGEVWMVGVIRV